MRQIPKMVIVMQERREGGVAGGYHHIDLLRHDEPRERLQSLLRRLAQIGQARERTYRTRKKPWFISG
jgi:hypothetical protein